MRGAGRARRPACAEVGEPTDDRDFGYNPGVMSAPSDYRKVGDSPLPPSRRIWEFRAAGVENLQLCERPLGRPGDDEVVVRIDAVGICASDVKIIKQGGRHHRLKGRDLARDPVTLGHEVAVTVVAAGRNRRDAFPPASRWTINPDIYVGGVNTSYGYKIPGALQEYQVLPAEVLDGWMLPLADHVGYAQGALTEPWACVYFSYTNHRPTRSVKKGGTAWYLGSGPVGLMHIEKGIADGAGRVVVSEANPSRLARVEQTLGALARTRGVELTLIDVNTAALETVLTKDGVDDILILAPVPALVTQAMPYLARNGVMNVFAGFPDRDASVLPVNFYDLHYKNAAIISTSGAAMDAMQRALEDSTSGRIDPNRAVAAVGGLSAVADGIRATADGSYPGRVLIYPQLDLPLTPVSALAEGGVWSNAAEERLLAGRGGGGK